MIELTLSARFARRIPCVAVMEQAGYLRVGDGDYGDLGHIGGGVGVVELADAALASMPEARRSFEHWTAEHPQTPEFDRKLGWLVASLDVDDASPQDVLELIEALPRP